MSELSRLDLQQKGIALTAEELFNPQGTSLVDGVCRVNGCTGSFVSSTGLIITNHHCAYGAIQKASTAERDFLQDGFLAQTLADEIPAADYTVRVTEDYRDVSREVLSAVTAEIPFLERTRAIDKRCKELEAAAEQEHPGLRAEVAEMFAGKTYVLFLYTYLKDIRLAFAPPQAIGNFGGEEDNWMWPRHTGDFSFLRAYTAPDGSSATYAAENIPYRPKRFIQVAPQGVRENDAVFLLGYPGRTARHKTASFLTYEQNIRLPTIVDLYNWQMEVLHAAGQEDRAVAIKHASRLRSLANVEKRSRGQLQGLRRANIIARRAADEARLQAYIEADEQRREKYGTLLAQIDSVYADISSAAEYEIHLTQLRSASRAFGIGFFLYDAAVERQKDDLDRESPYMDRNWEQSVQELLTTMGDYHAATDELILAGMLERLQHSEAARTNPVLAPLLQAPGQLPQLAEQLTAGTQLGDAAFVQIALQQTPDELSQLDDPLLQLVVGLYPTYVALREKEKSRDGQLGQLYGELIDVKQQFLETNFVPDANGTLRFTSGTVRSYSPADAILKTPITTFRGVVEKTTGIEPFITPPEVMEKYLARDFGPYRNEPLQDIPVALLYDTDTTGGNSGSPIFNGRGQLVGVNFDRCFEATINDFAWDQSYSRSIGVDIRYVLWLTGIVYGAEHLLEEMNVR
ncbi:MAG: S46 family peptidase [Planctomycetales bacterium]|nr:S46 family peptidase [Planctomycetales bacterium]